MKSYQSGGQSPTFSPFRSTSAMQLINQKNKTL
jgi:hypothetical protein